MKDTFFYSKFLLNLKGNLTEFSEPVVMGIINVTPDSFFERSRTLDIEAVISKAESMLAAGADILDIGGYSSRPGAVEVSESEELKRVIPAIEAIISHFPDAIISIDTFRSQVAEAALKAGAAIVNDISGGQQDEQLFHVAAKYFAPVIIMHMRGTPQTMMNDLSYTNLAIDVNEYFSRQILKAKAAGVVDLILDPGFGFSKNLDQNFELLGKLGLLHLHDCPILVGISRKSMIYNKLKTSPEESLNGTTALNMLALCQGASILRVHDVKEAKECVALYSATRCKELH